jgi:hypothetical protein
MEMHKQSHYLSFPSNTSPKTCAEYIQHKKTYPGCGPASADLKAEVLLIRRSPVTSLALADEVT